MIGIGANVHRLAALPLRIEAICGNVAVGCELRHASPHQAGRDVVFQKKSYPQNGKGAQYGHLHHRGTGRFSREGACIAMRSWPPLEKIPPIICGTSIDFADRMR